MSRVIKSSISLSLSLDCCLIFFVDFYNFSKLRFKYEYDPMVEGSEVTALLRTISITMMHPVADFLLTDNLFKFNLPLNLCF